MATTANGQLATAASTATGSGGTIDSTANTQGGVVTGVSAFASAPVDSTENDSTRSSAQNGTVQGFNGMSDNSYAFATEAPSAGFVSTTLGNNNNLNTALSGGTVFGEASQGAFMSSSASGLHEYNSTIAFTVNTTSLSGDLIAGLIGDQSFGTGFTSLDFNVVENGKQIFDQSFTTLSADNTFFTNHALDLGTFATGPGQVVDFNFDLTTNTAGNGFGDEFLLGTTGGAICFVPGTLIRTPREEVAVETLKRGDLLITTDGRTMPVSWIGRQTVSTVFGDP